MPHQVVAALDGVGVAIGNDKEVVGNGGEGVVIMVRDDDVTSNFESTFFSKGKSTDFRKVKSTP